MRLEGWGRPPPRAGQACPGSRDASPYACAYRNARAYAAMLLSLRPREARHRRTWPRTSDRIIVVGAGPVGLCLSLALAQAGVQVCLIEALGDDNFLEQVPRAGTNHPATLEMLDRIGLYARLEPRGIVAPLFHYWERRDHELIAAFDHGHLKDDTRFPYRAAMRAHQDRRGGARARQGASEHRPADVHDLHRRSRKMPTASPRR